MQDTSPKKAGMQLQKNVGKVKQMNKIVDKFIETNPKKEFINQYGVELQMTAAYTFTGLFYRQDRDFLITINRLISPKDVSYYDFDKINSNEPNNEDTEFKKKKLELNKSMLIRIYQLVDEKYTLVNTRVCHPSFKNKLCISEDGTKLAIVRKPSNVNVLAQSMFRKEQEQEITIFDCSKVSFFLKKEPLTIDDPDLLLTIKDPNLHNSKKMEETFMRFSNCSQYLYMIFGRINILAYKLEANENKQILTTAINQQIPSMYETIINFAVNEQDISQSLFACKKRDFRNIDIFTLDFITELKELEGGDLMDQKSFIKENCQKYQKGTIRFTDLELSGMKLKFSHDLTQVFFSNKEQNLILTLATNTEASHQKSMHHLEGKHSIQVSKDGDKNFIIATAKTQDNEITLRYSADPTAKITFQIRYVSGHVQIRDIQVVEDKVRLLITRDDEEFLIYEFDVNYKNSSCKMQRFTETSKYSFEWPYICYLEGQSQIVILNAFDPKKITIIDMSKYLPNHSYVSDVQLSESLDLYILVTTPDKYLLYEKDLDRIMGLIINSTDYKGETQSRASQYLRRNQTVKPQYAAEESKPINTILRSNLANGIQPYKFFVRGSSSKEQIQLNLERIVFFVADFKLYAMLPTGKLSYIDTCHAIKKLNENIYAYTTRDEHKQQGNEVKYLKIGYSEYSSQKVVEEFGGKLQSFQVTPSQVFVLVKTGEKYFLRVYTVSQNLHSKLKISQELKQSKYENFLGNFSISEQMVNTIIPAANNLYNIVITNKTLNIHHFNQVLPLQEFGDVVCYDSPKIDIDYRKMAYFITNKSNQNSKTAIIIPYLNDHFVMFNTRQNITSFCNFSSKMNFKTQKHMHEIINIVPYTQSLYRYALNGQLLQRVNLETMFQEYGEVILSTSPNGTHFLQTFEDLADVKQVNIIKIDTIHNKQYPKGHAKVGSSAQEALKAMNTINHEQDKFENQLDIQIIEEIDLYSIKVPNGIYQEIYLNNLGDIIEYFESLGCKAVYKLNDNMDIVLAFLYKNKSQQLKSTPIYLKEMFLIKRINNIRELFCVRIKTEQGEKIIKMKKQENKKDLNHLTSRLLSYAGQNPDALDKRTALFWALQELQDCYDFCLSNDHIMLWSKERIFYGVLNVFNSLNNSISVKKSKFQIDDIEEAQIVQVVSKQQSQEDIRDGNCYITIKINIENKFCTMSKYNIYKDKEFTSFDCNVDSEIFYDTQFKSFILDKHSIIDINQGVPLYFYKTGSSDINKKYLIGESLISGARFCKENTHFLVRNKVHMPYSYYSLILIENLQGKQLTHETYDSEALFCLNGNTSFHNFANSFKNLSFLLEQYEKSNPKIINLLLLKNQDGKNVLDLALEKQSSRCVNLILSKLGSISMNNIHQVKNNFSKLLTYSSFEQYLGLCYFQTDQMKLKTVMQCKKTRDTSSEWYVDAHPTCFLDKGFYETFKDDSQPMKPINIKAIDAGWILKSEDGKAFIGVLSNSNNMNYFQLESIRLLVNYQWKFYKSSIIKWLFVPFLVSMVLFNLYAVIAFDNYRRDPTNILYAEANTALQISLLLFTFQTVYVEAKQIAFHRVEYIQSVWNIFDLITVVLTPLIVIMDIANFPDSFVRPLMAVCLLFFYMRLFYYLRIFDTTAHLVRSILEISNDIKYFLLVLLIGIVGFGGSFLVLSNNNADTSENKFEIENFPYAVLYSYKLILGEFEIDGFNNASNPLLLWIFFIISTLFTMIILLNMLIAIMGDSFNAVNEQSENQRVREHLQLIVENDFLIDREKVFKNVKYLIAINDDNEDAEQDQIAESMTILKKGFSKKFKGMHTHIKVLLETGVFHNKQFQMLKKDMQELKELMVKQGETIENYSSNDKEDRSSQNQMPIRQVFNRDPVGFQFNRNLNTE